MARRRADTLLAERGLARSRTGAAEAIRAGAVRVGADGPRLVRPSDLVAADAELIVESGPRYASRGGIKLENALAALAVDPAGLDCLDVGASTGGFTDCLLQHGAERVIALDVAQGQLDWGLRNDARVTVLERRNARELTAAELPLAPALVTVDISFISLAKVLPALATCLAERADVLALVKPQFELGRDRVGKGGVVRSAEDRREAIGAVADVAPSTGLCVRGFAPSGLPGPRGNCETFIHLANHGEPLADLAASIAEVDA